MADLKQKYGSKTNLTITLASLADSGARESTVVDNGTNLFVDVLIGGKLKAGASGVSSTGYVNIWAYGSADDGTLYDDACTGSDAAHTMNGNAKLLAVLEMNANAEVVEFTVPLSRVFNHIPEDWGIIVENKSGATFDTTAGNFEIHYKGLHLQTV